MTKGLEAYKKMKNKMIYQVALKGKTEVQEEWSIIEKELEEGEKAKQVTSIIFRMFIDDIDINKVLFEVSISDSFERFKTVYPNAIKEEYELLKEVLL